MKKNLLLMITMMIMLNVSLAQEITQRYIINCSFDRDKIEKPKANSSEYFLLKATKLESTSWKLASVGAALGIAGLLLYNEKDYSQRQMGASFSYSSGAKILMFSGAFLVVTSIPVYLKSVHYKNKGLAMTTSLNIESVRDMNQSGMLIKYYPALALHVHL